MHGNKRIHGHLPMHDPAVEVIEEGAIAAGGIAFRYVLGGFVSAATAIAALSIHGFWEQLGSTQEYMEQQKEIERELRFRHGYGAKKTPVPPEVAQGIIDTGKAIVSRVFGRHKIITRANSAEPFYTYGNRCPCRIATTRFGSNRKRKRKFVCK